MPVPDDTVGISVVMPAHNEEALLASSVASVVEGLGGRGVSFEVIVVENGSTDATVEVATRIAADHDEVHVLRHPEPDYGRSLRAGFLAARGSSVVNFDVDYTDLDFLTKAVDLIESPGGPAIVVGTKRGSGADDRRSAGRRLVTLVFSTLLRLGFGLRASDTHGMKALNRLLVLDQVERCRFGRDLFDTELVIRVERAGLRVDELPVQVLELRPSRTPIVRRIPRTLAGLLRLRLTLGRERRASRRNEHRV